MRPPPVALEGAFEFSLASNSGALTLHSKVVPGERRASPVSGPHPVLCFVRRRESQGGVRF